MEIDFKVTKMRKGRKPSIRKGWIPPPNSKKMPHFKPPVEDKTPKYVYPHDWKESVEKWDSCMIQDCPNPASYKCNKTLMFSRSW